MGLLGLFKTKYSLQESRLLKGSTDRHSHILYGVDDGIKTLEDSLAVLSFLETLGVKELWCTPHVMEDVPNATEDLKARFSELCSHYKGSIELHLAAEYMLDTVFEKRLDEKDLLLMEDDFILVETSTIAPPYDLMGSLKSIMSAGYRPLLAHPERYRFLKEKDFEPLHDAGVRFQLNLASVTGYYGETARKKAEFILEKGWYMASGSDCHRLSSIRQQYAHKSLSSGVIRQLSAIL